MKFKDWKDITLKQFKDITELLEEQDEYTGYNLLDIIYGIDSANMTVQEVSKYSGALDFLKTEVPHVKVEKEYTINGREYTLDTDVSHIITSQFIDYTNYTNGEIKDYNNILSVFFIPKGHGYNDGYDMNQVKEDMNDVPLPVVTTSAFFFEKEFELLLKHFQHYLTRLTKKVKNPKAKILIETLERLDLKDMVTYRLS